ncbi:glycoside hydrolase family 3 N-terminal domain-containing protein [Vibrio sp.]|uniref:glycoside hydrolase family 3 protein n=1 Tax=Vibrio sp. TaxID=678 RepID=UPI003D132975
MTMKTEFNTPYFAKWPKIESAIAVDPDIEQRVAAIVAQMTLEEKVGQMIQPEIRDVTPQDIIEFKIGSVLNGGGSWPNNNKRAPASEWVLKADQYWLATEQMFAGRPFRIPFMWATDAVHGHNNVYGATVFPHNIGLGCAREPELIRRIGRVTALEIAATGLDWTFAPTVATPRDLRWGRTYEGYSEDPELVYAYASEMVHGLQGDAEQLQGEFHVISNVKHWVGDGGTATGVDRGINHYSEELLRNIHAMGYFSGLNAGAQVVMSSFNCWDNPANYDHAPQQPGEYNFKIHGSKYLLTDVLKDLMGFDGLVVTDWHGHAEVSKCSDGDATYAINAGNDVLMIPVGVHWRAAYRKTLDDVRSGVIAQSRIDDAVTRILRVKMRAGLWQKPMPSERACAGEQQLIGAPQHRALAREAVRKSLVLLKNNQNLLPLSPNQRLILTGSAANDLQKQSGGWNLTWQGDENCLEDFPGATTLKMALEAEMTPDSLIFDPDLTRDYQPGDVAIVAFGEDPYAEMMGDIKAWQSLEFATLKRSYAADSAKIRQLHQQGVKVIGLFFSGRPLYLNQEINQCEAFVAAFLPGSEGLGLTDVLLADAQGQARFDFCGKLSFSWPNKKRSCTVHRIPPHIPGYQLADNEQSPTGEHAPLFEYGYGLTYLDGQPERDLDNLTLDNEQNDQSGQAYAATHLYGVLATIGDYQLKVADQQHLGGVDVSRNNVMTLSDLNTKPYNYLQQQDSVELNFNGGYCAAYVETGDGKPEDLSSYANHNGKICFELKVLRACEQPVYLAVQKGASFEQQTELARVDLSQWTREAREQFVRIEIPCQQFVEQGVNFAYLDVPFMLYSDGPFHAVLANVSWDAPID